MIGAGPAGLMAAETLSGAGLRVTVYERMPSAGRKLLLAGRGGLNLTHTEERAPFLARYGSAAPWLTPVIDAFPATALRAWAEGLGQTTFVGSSGRVFPTAMKASPLLRAWLGRLRDQGVQLRTGHEWRGWDDAGRLAFRRPDGPDVSVTPAATVLALGGASWPRLGADGSWVGPLSRAGIAVTPLRPANCGFTAAWSDSFRGRFAGQPLKKITLSFAGRTVPGEVVVSEYGIEGGAAYALSASLRDAIAAGGPARLAIDLRPDLSVAELAGRLARPKPGQSLANVLRKAAGLTPVAINLLREAGEVPREAERLAALIKAVRLLTAPQPLARDLDRGRRGAGRDRPAADAAPAPRCVRRRRDAGLGGATAASRCRRCWRRAGGGARPAAALAPATRGGGDHRPHSASEGRPGIRVSSTLAEHELQRDGADLGRARASVLMRSRRVDVVMAYSTGKMSSARLVELRRGGSSLS